MIILCGADFQVVSILILFKNPCVLIGKILLFIARCISCILFAGLKHVLNYRYAVIHGNFIKVFPEKNEKELKELIDEYYHHISDLCVEPFLFYLAPASLRKNLMVFEDSALLDELYRHKKNVVMLASHYGNWEYLADLPERTKYQVCSGYSPVKSRLVNNFMYRIRSRFGVNLIPKQSFYRRSLDLLSRKDQLNMVVVIGDQRPAPDSRKYHVPFLGIQTDVQTGAERIAMHADTAVVLIESVRIGRFKYSYQVDLITGSAAGSKPLTITAGYFARLEKSIRRSPAQWLWSHNRWKGQKDRGHIERFGDTLEGAVTPGMLPEPDRQNPVWLYPAMFAAAFIAGLIETVK